MFYVGLDIHTKHISICALNETGQVGGHGGEWVSEYVCEKDQASWTEREPR
jgi:hypothetical protein